MVTSRKQIPTKKKAPAAGAKGKKGTIAPPKAAKPKREVKVPEKSPPVSAKKMMTKVKGAKKEPGREMEPTQKTKIEEKIKLSPPSKVTKRISRPIQTEVEEPAMAEDHEVSFKKIKIDPEFLKTVMEALVNQRQRLLSVVQSTQAQLAAKEVDLPDVSDRASGGFEDELAMGLMAIEAAQIDDIEAAIARISEGTYGQCANCGKPIPKRRLEVLPFARRCLNCEGERERHAMRSAEFEEEDEAL